MQPSFDFVMKVSRHLRSVDEAEAAAKEMLAAGAEVQITDLSYRSGGLHADDRAIITETTITGWAWVAR